MLCLAEAPREGSSVGPQPRSRSRPTSTHVLTPEPANVQAKAAKGLQVISGNVSGFCPLGGLPG